VQTYILRRLLALIPTLFFASLIVFVTVRLIPGNVIDLMLSQNDIAVGKDRMQLEAALGLDRPMLIQYFRWIGAALQGDLGRSLWQNTPVTAQLVERLPVTFELGLLALTVALGVALPIGVYSAIRQDTAGDYLTRSFSILMLAIPSFWLGTLVMVFPSIWWGWSPELKYVPFRREPLQNLSQMILPAVILGTSLSAVTMRLTRTMMLEVLRQDYIRTAWAKGLSERPVVARHALRNALIPVVTLIGLYDKKMAEVYLTRDESKRQQMIREMTVEILDKAPYVWLPTPYIFTAWWPWVQNYNGELRAGAVRPGPIYARIWIDQEMKKKMGFRADAASGDPPGGPGVAPASPSEDLDTPGGEPGVEQGVGARDRAVTHLVDPQRPRQLRPGEAAEVDGAERRHVAAELRPVVGPRGPAVAHTPAALVPGAKAIDNLHDHGALGRVRA
jgi:peptide/nickel transport system permease protein